MRMDDDESELLVSLRRWCDAALPREERARASQQLLNLVKSQRVRDVEKLPREAYRLLVTSVILSWQGEGGQERDDVQASFTGIRAILEFDIATAEEFVDDGFLVQLCDRFHLGVSEERAFLRDTLHWAYASFPYKRPLLRRQIGAVLRQFVRMPSRNTHVAEMLQVVCQVIKGFPQRLTEVHQSLLAVVLLPLHEPDQMAVWSIQQPLIESYHEALVGCLVPFLERQPDLTQLVFEAIVAAWPQGFQSNTPKEVLLLHEVGTLVKFVPPEACRPILQVVMPKGQGYVKPLLSALLRGGEPFWNPTVNKMTAHVLENLEALDYETFAAACESVWGDGVPSPADGTFDGKAGSDKPGSPAEEAAYRVDAVADGRFPPTTIKGAMGSWRPPVRGGGVHRGVPNVSRDPPAAITGVAPWAIQTPQRSTKSQVTHILGTARTGRKGLVPPTHALKRPLPRDSETAGRGGDRRNGPDGHGDSDDGEARESEAVTEPTDRNPDPTLSAGNNDSQHVAYTSSISDASRPSPDEGGEGSRNIEGPGLRRVHQFMLKIKPKDADGPSGPSWQELQLEPTPTLLPDLRFHDLVFGHELGQGSFSSVKYARQITKGKSRSEWPEFAVKIISETKIQELNYEKSVTNEIACLRALSHPGIARLISAFRWRDGAYLVLEYASRGDLHTHIKQHGSLSEASASFVIGEVVAALCSVHDYGFVFGDLKPENILITESGHIKIADFGACRPVTAATKDILDRSRGALRTLRDGDWRVAAGLPPNPMYTFPTRRGPGDTDSDDSEDGTGTCKHERERNVNEEEESRAEGTAAYLPPEVARGGVLTFGADAWALGCVTFLCLAGRPPIFAETDEAIMARVVRFSPSGVNSTGEGDEVLKGFPAELSKDPASFVRALMQPDPQLRLSVEHAAKHAFLTRGDVDVFSLHQRKPVELAQGTVAPVPNAAWSRRQNSMIWAPMPQEYRFDAGSRTLEIIPETDVECQVFFERQFGAIRELSS